LNQDKDKPPADSESREKTERKSSSDFVTPSVLLFTDHLLVSVGGWLYWLVISKLTLASEIGLAVTVYSLVMLLTTLTQLGLEYPLLKKSIVPGSRILGTSLVIELVIAMASIPFVFIVINTVYDESIKDFIWISVALLVILSIEFIARFGLLGLSNARTVLIIDLIGLAIKLPTGFILVYMSVGAIGILLAYLLEGLFITLASLFILKKTFSIQIGNSRHFKETIKDALINTPAKWSKMVIVTLSIVLLAFMNINASDVGIFYVALMISIVVASVASSMAYMVIPSSSTLRTDLSTSSLRISLSLTAPIVVALLVVPRSILSLIGPEYESAETVLLVLAMAIIPSSITVNIISKLNNLGKSNMLILTGLVQIVVFFVSFFFLVPQYQTMGAAISILVAYLSSALFLVIFTDHGSFRYIVSACLSVFAGFITGYSIGMITGHEQYAQQLLLLCSIGASIVVIFASKNMTIKETRFILKAMLQRKGGDF
jgi:O-antigen/teichoic acid export membrane protein